MNSTADTTVAASDLVGSVVETLQQGETLLSEISDEAFTRKVPVAFNASIGIVVSTTNNNRDLFAGSNELRYLFNCIIKAAFACRA